MRKRSFGETEIKVSELSLGTWGLSGDAYGPVSEKTQDAVIERALALGINVFETADIYADGEMEARLARRVPAEDTYLIVTKIGTDLKGEPQRKRFDEAYLKEAFARCQERQKRERLDVVLLHNPSQQAMSRGECAELMQSYVDAGKLRAWGVSIGTKAVGLAAVHGKHKPAIIQLAFNALYSAGLVGLEYSIPKKIAIFARSVLAHGLLTGAWKGDKVFDTGDHRTDRWTSDQLERRLHQLKALRGLHNGQIQSVRAAALRFVLDNTHITSAVIGPKDVIQLDQLVREAGTKEPYLDAAAKRRVLKRLHEVGALRP